MPLVPPPTPREIHSHPCVHCPSTKGPDPMTQDIIDHYPRSEQLQSVFACAWRPGKLCKGYCDALGVTESELVSVNLDSESPKLG
jgi:hypothetical protein